MTGTKGISKKYARRTLDKSNPLRQYSPQALEEYATKANEILDLFSKYLEDSMEVSAGVGRGSRMTKEHIELHFGKFYFKMRKALDGEKNE